MNWSVSPSSCNPMYWILDSTVCFTAGKTPSLPAGGFVPLEMCVYILFIYVYIYIYITVCLHYILLLYRIYRSILCSTWESYSGFVHVEISGINNDPCLTSFQLSSQRLGGPRVCANPGTWEVLWSQDGGWSSQLVCRWSLLPFRFSAQQTRCTCILMFGMGRPFSGEHAARFWTLLTSTALKDISWDPSSRFGKLCWACRAELFDTFCLNVLISWFDVGMFKSVCINGSFVIIWNHLLCFPHWKTMCEQYFDMLHFEYDMRILAFTHERTVNLWFSILVKNIRR